jgi:hypothetical protein
MAYSADSNQLQMFQDLVLAPADLELPRPLRAMAYWCTANRQAADYGEASLGDRYHLLRFEDLCLDPELAIAKLAAFVAAPIDVPAAAAQIRPPASIGRWRSHPAAEIRALVELGRTALDRFGYAYPPPRDSLSSA